MDKYKHDADYISYIESGKSAAVFVVRDIVRSIDTSGMWIDILSLDGSKNEDDRWDFQYFTIELFPRKKYPQYPDYATDKEKKYITWETACIDIDEQRSRGYKGVKFRIHPKLVNRNKGKYRKTKGREKKTPCKPKWDYAILAIKRL